MWLVLVSATQPVWMTPVSQCDWSLFLLLTQGEWLLSACVTGPCFCYSASVSDSCQPVWLVLVSATQPGWVTPVSQCDLSLFLLLRQCEWLQSVSVTGPWSSSHSASVSDSCQSVWLVLVSATQPVWVTPVSVTGPWSSSHSASVSDSTTGPCFCYSASVSDSSHFQTTVFTLSVHLSVRPWRFGFSLISWKGNDGNSSNFADTLISIRCMFIIEN